MAFQAFLMARGHISASFHLQRSNKGPLESSRQGAHDRAKIPDFIKYDPGPVFRPTMCHTSTAVLHVLLAEPGGKYHLSLSSNIAKSNIASLPSNIAKDTKFSTRVPMQM
jgi:hypothetical protein